MELLIMSRVIVIYDTRSGNTEKMAKAVAEGCKAKSVQVDLFKIGTPFDISLVDLADAIIFGSPSHYASPTTEIRAFIESMKNLKEAKMLKLKGKIGGAFGSYAWDGGWAAEKLKADMMALGIDVVGNVVSAVDRMGGMGIRISEEDLKKCRELGRVIAEKVAVKT
jgi:NAD(P)H dehydrogenase (quinone)